MMTELEFWDQCALAALSAGAADPVANADSVLDARRERHRADEVAKRLLPAPPDPREVLPSERDLALLHDGLIPAIKAYRARTNSSLVDAKRAVELATGRTFFKK